jgi:hypothetical protein
MGPACKRFTLTADAGGPRPIGKKTLPSTLAAAPLLELHDVMERPSSTVAPTASSAWCGRMRCICEMAARCDTNAQYCSDIPRYIHVTLYRAAVQKANKGTTPQEGIMLRMSKTKWTPVVCGKPHTEV